MNFILVPSYDATNSIVHERLSLACGYLKEDSRIILCGNYDKLINNEIYLTNYGIAKQSIIKLHNSNELHNMINEIINVLFIYDKLKSKNSKLIIISDKYDEINNAMKELWDESYLPYVIYDN